MVTMLVGKGSGVTAPLAAPSPRIQSPACDLALKVVPPFPQMSHPKATRNVQVTSSSAEKMANAFLKDGFVTTTKIAMAERTNIVARPLTVNLESLLVAPTNIIKPTVFLNITDVMDTRIARITAMKLVVPQGTQIQMTSNVANWKIMTEKFTFPRARNVTDTMIVVTNLTSLIVMVCQLPAS